MAAVGGYVQFFYYRDPSVPSPQQSHNISSNPEIEAIKLGISEFWMFQF